MSKHDKLFDKIVSGNADASIRFDSMRILLAQLGFRERIRGSHHIFTREGIEALIDLQPKQGKCKP